jgi:hypothetical protein
MSEQFFTWLHQPANPAFTLVAIVGGLMFGFKFLGSRDWFIRMCGVALIVGMLGSLAGIFPLKVTP